jgi:hypothetical protein
MELLLALLKLAVSYWLVKGCGDLFGFGRRSEAWASHRTQRALLYLAFMYLAIQMPPGVIFKVLMYWSVQRW